MKRIVVMAAALLGLSAAASATDLSYDYLELRWVDTEIGNADGDGFRLAGSFQTAENWFVIADINAIDFDFDIDLTSFSVGAGYLLRYDEKFDLIGTARLIRASVDTPFGDDDENGYQISAGTRVQPVEQVEVRAFLNHVDVADRDTFIEVGADYYFDPRFSVGATLEFAGDADTLTLGVRWFFGN